MCKIAWVGNEFIDIIGVNNRDLRNFKVDVERSIYLSSLIPHDFLKISESGISNPKTIIQLRDAGFHGFLIGENFMKSDDPAATFGDFVKEIHKLIDGKL